MKRSTLIKNTVPAPAGIDSSLANLVEALARQAARDDYARHLASGNDNEKSGDLCPILDRPSDRSVD
ncbi:hypothetical protein EN866_33415 [Mesorhizobium sp. M2D.F.Ca.ET.223.01.1.1]|uniref:hypothetical protein n=1 Tax=Mesorhizobium sp. M2D.F.Ca.ET.223.01.1.1 TaxID=2563940 RepID=UPI0010930FEC|nr:hypothetical protein [Mesorhizobium sp. M2D.F.Ca.ET.223.01.1.1]TGR84245.1 hypothetical protein EN866_33415 [Mesorhizobium sp. M2D.F.Ca.ET.223.01.1.1]TGT75205.1 hypothetical protein EN802_09380 [bacterium M00.F.Ca.ET.159.01.1.1]TGT88072.1 hypothetical protein EN800_06270 [bacterium M00.F.Ca.ET.157.01.1.1]